MNEFLAIQVRLGRITIEQIRTKFGYITADAVAMLVQRS